MKVPYSWLKEFVDTDLSPEELGDKLVSAGFEIEEYIYLKNSIKNVVVGKVESIVKHEHSDHLNICQVNVGDKVLQIVTGAQNVRAGDLVPVALDGAVLPDGKTIKNGELRGEKSYGMLCSGGELDLVEDDYPGAGVNGILILKKTEKIGADINNVIGNTEVVLDVSITANRPDCNSILGIAREVAVVLDKPLKMPDFTYEEDESHNINEYLTVENREFGICPRYMSKMVVDAVQTQSPKIIRDRLKAVGIRPINNLVDVTNYVLIEIGQPMHAFDYNNISGKKIVIRAAQHGEKITALDGKEYTLGKDNLMICDEQKPIAVAGVMGGEYSSVCDTTKTLVLESARFARDSVRHTARALNLHSDSSARFEKGIDFISQELGMKRVLNLFCKYGWGKVVSGVIDACNTEIKNKIIEYNYDNINAIIGVKIPKEAIIDILNRLGIVTTANGDTLQSVIPLFRDDIDGVNDLTEEVIRIYGYDVVIPRVISNCRGGKTDEQLRSDKIKNTLVGKGAFEIVSYSFITPKAYDMLMLREDSPLRRYIALKNPIGIDMSVMRTTLSYSMIKTIEYNFKRGNKEGRLFEVGNTYIPDSLPLEKLPEEKTKLMLGFFGPDEDFYSLKSVIEDLGEILGYKFNYKRANIEYLHPGRSACITDEKGHHIGYIGELHPDVAEQFDVESRIYIAELDFEYLVANGIDIKPFKPISKYQGVQRDLALLAPEKLPAAEILETIYKEAGSILEDCEVFDVYVGGQIPVGKKSIAVKLYFRDVTKTLTDNDVNKEITKILEGLSEKDTILR